MPQALSYLLTPSPAAEPKGAGADAARRRRHDEATAAGGSGDGSVLAALDSVADEVDFGTIAVYTCTGSCATGCSGSVAGAWGAREFAHVQPMSGAEPRRRGQEAVDDEGERAEGGE